MAKKALNFFLNGKLHRRLAVNRGRDLLYAWCYSEHKRYTFTYSDALRRMEPAFTSSQVAKMLGRHKNIVERAVWQEQVPKPEFSYGLETGILHQYLWGEEDILRLLDYLSGIHYGRPRKDGLIVPKALPTPREVRAMCRDEKALFSKKDYKPAFRPGTIRSKN